eukprot:COSAG06_NODE_2085_length_7634_cov_6.358593_3_plen_618_part_00
MCVAAISHAVDVLVKDEKLALKIDDIDDTDDPKGAAIDLIVQATPAAEDGEGSQAAAALRSELEGLRLRGLKLKAASLGVDETTIERFDTFDSPKQAAISAIVAATPFEPDLAGEAASALRSELQSLRLDALKQRLTLLVCETEQWRSPAWRWRKPTSVADVAQNTTLRIRTQGLRRPAPPVQRKRGPREYYAGQLLWVRGFRRPGYGYRVGWRRWEVRAIGESGKPIFTEDAGAKNETYEEVAAALPVSPGQSVWVNMDADGDSDWILAVVATSSDGGVDFDAEMPLVHLPDSTAGTKLSTASCYDTALGPGFTFEDLDNEDRSTWSYAMQRNGDSKCSALVTGGARLLLWHLVQPPMYFLVLATYHSDIDHLQLGLGVAVACREAGYLVTTLACVYYNPAFLLVDVATTVRQQSHPIEKLIPVLMYVLAPEKFVAFSLFGRGGAATLDSSNDLIAFLTVIYGFVSTALDMCGVAALVAGLASGKLPLALGIGYAVTALGGTLLAGAGILAALAIAINDAKSVAEAIALGIGLLATPVTVLGWAIGVPVAINTGVSSHKIWLAAIGAPLMTLVSVFAVDPEEAFTGSNRFVLSVVDGIISLGLLLVGTWLYTTGLG